MSINVCLIGAGRIGRIHAANLTHHPGATLAAVVDTDAAAAAALAKRHGAAVRDVDTALADPNLDAVVIASSTDTHLVLIEACSKAGKPMLCEKPLDLDIGRAGRAVQLAEAAGVPLFIGFNRRFDPSFRRIHDDVAADAIGAVEVVTITSRDPEPPLIDYVRRSGGLFRDMTIHDLDMARWLLGEEPVRVFATARCLVEPAIGESGDVDTAVLVLETARGGMCQITNSRRCAYGYDQRVEVFGARGMLRVDNRSATGVEQAGAAGVLREPALPFFLERYQEAYRLEMDDFVRAVEGGANTLARARDGLQALLLAEAAEMSRREQSSVPVPEWKQNSDIVLD